MALDAIKAGRAAPECEQAIDALERARERTLALVAPPGHDQLERVHSPIMSPLAWDLAHIAAYEDLWIGQRHGGRELLRAELASVDDAFETARARSAATSERSRRPGRATTWRRCARAASSSSRRRGSATESSSRWSHAT